MPTRTRKERVIRFVIGSLLLLGGIYTSVMLVYFFLGFGQVSYTYFLPIPFGVSLCGVALIFQSILSKSARK